MQSRFPGSLFRYGSVLHLYCYCNHCRLFCKFSDCKRTDAVARWFQRQFNCIVVSIVRSTNPYKCVCCWQCYLYTVYTEDHTASRRNISTTIVFVCGLFWERLVRVVRETWLLSETWKRPWRVSQHSWVMNIYVPFREEIGGRVSY